MTIRDTATLLWTLVIVLLLCGCTSQKVSPVVWTDSQVVISNYQALQIRPVFNATEYPVKDTILTDLAVYLTEQFQMRHLKVLAAPEMSSGVLAVESDLLVFVPSEHLAIYKPWTRPMWGRGQCSVRVRLVDKATSQLVAEIYTTKQINTSFYGITAVSTNKTTEWMLRDIAAKVAEEVARLMEGEAHRVNPG